MPPSPSCTLLSSIACVPCSTWISRSTQGAWYPSPVSILQGDPQSFVLIRDAVKLPEGSLLSPSETAAVCGGNVLTSQRIVDVVLKAFHACAASQGCTKWVITTVVDISTLIVPLAISLLAREARIRMETMSPVGATTRYTLYSLTPE